MSNAVAVRNAPAVVDRLVRDNGRLVPHLVKPFAASVLGFDELVAEGNVGLVIAAQRFDESRGVAFSTYASWWIRARVKSAIQAEAGCGKQRQMRKLFWGIRRAYHTVAVDDGSATSDAIGAYLGVEAELVEQMRMHLVAGPVHLDAHWSSDGDDTIGDKLLIDQAPSAEERLLDGERLGIARGDLRRALRRLTTRERYVIRQVHLIANRRTRADIARELGTSRQRVQQIEIEALGKIRRSLVAFSRRQARIPTWCDA
jgi:RNA polymerase sigma-32 factor